MNVKLIAGLALAALIFAVVPAAAADPKTVAGVLAESKDHKVLLEAAAQTRLLDALKTDEWTVFAPTDAAFKRVDPDVVKKMAADKEAFKRFVRNHAVKGKLSSADLVKLDGKEVEALSGAKFKVRVEGKNVFVGGAKLTALDAKASNGVVHVTDAALLPK